MRLFIVVMLFISVLIGVSAIWGFKSVSVVVAAPPPKAKVVPTVIDVIDTPISQYEGSNPILDPRVFETMQEAATYAIQESYDFSTQFEYGGMILKGPNNEYRVTIPYTIGADDHMLIKHIHQLGPYNGVADYHTHPCMPYTHIPGLFSDPDITDYITNGLIGYMGDLCTGNVHEFNADIDHAGDYTVQYIQIKLTYGRVIGHINIWKKPVLQESPPTFNDLIQSLSPSD